MAFFDKLKKYFINKIKSIITIKGFILAFSTLVIMAVFFFYFNKSFNYSIGNSFECEAYKLENGIEYNQKLYINKCNLKGIEIHFDTFSKINEGTIALDLKADNQVIKTWEVDASSLIDNEYYIFLLDKPLYIDINKDYYIGLSYSFSGDNDIAAYLTSSEGDISFGENVIAKSAFSLAYSVENSNAKSKCDRFLTIILIIIFIFLFAIIDINSYSIKKLVVISIALLMLIRVVRYDLLLEISNSTNLIEYRDEDALLNQKKEDYTSHEDNYNLEIEKNNETVSVEKNLTYVIKSGETKTYFATGMPKQFTNFKFFYNGAYNSKIHVVMKGMQDNKVYFDADIDDNYIIPVQSAGKFAVCLYKEEDFPKGDYTLNITNVGENDFVVDIIDDTSLNITVEKETYVAYIIAIIVLGLLTIYFIYFICIAIKKYEISKLFLALVIPLSIIYLIMFLPWSQPDTKTHYLATYRLSNLLMGYGEDKEWYGRQEDSMLIDKVFVDETWEMKDPCLRDYTSIIYNTHLKCEDATLVDFTTHQDKMKFYSFVNYLPQVLGLTIGRCLNLSAVLCMYLARIFILLVYILGMYNAVKKTPVGKGIIALIALTPMCLMMSSAISYDALVIISTFNFISSVLSLYTDKYNKKKFVEVMIWTFVMGSVKAGGFLILLPLVFILFEKDSIKKSLISVGSIVGAGVFAALLFDVIIPAGSKLFQFGTDNSDKLSASFAIHNPLRFFDMASKSYIELLDKLAINTAGTYLAWLENTIPATIIFILLILTGLYSMFEKDNINLKKSFKVIYFLIIVVSLVSTPVMLMSWTDVGSSKVLGLQGRYYLPVLPIVFLWLTKYNLHDQYDSDEKKIALNKIVIWFSVLSGIAVYYLLRLYLTR